MFAEFSVTLCKVEIVDSESVWPSPESKPGPSCSKPRVS